MSPRKRTLKFRLNALNNLNALNALSSIAAARLELNDAVSECPTTFGQVFACTEQRCKRMGLVVHAHSKRPYLVLSKRQMESAGL